MNETEQSIPLQRRTARQFIPLPSRAMSKPASRFIGIIRMTSRRARDRDHSTVRDDSSLDALLADLVGQRPSRWHPWAASLRASGKRMTLTANLSRLRAELDRQYADLAVHF